MTSAACALLLLHCGSRTDLSQVLSTGPLPDASPPADATPHFEASPSVDAPVDVTPPPFDAPTDVTPDVSPPDASCTAAPAGGITIATFPSTVARMGLAVANGRAFTGTDSFQSPSLPLSGIFETPTTGGATQPLMALSYIFGEVLTDGRQLYYPQMQATQGSFGPTYAGLGLAAIDLATGAMVYPGGPAASPTATPVAATTAWPGVVWTSNDSTAGTTLWSFSSQTMTSSSLATVPSLSGVAVDGSGVYWGDASDAQTLVLHHLPLGGGQDTPVAKVPSHGGVVLGVSSADVVFVGDFQTSTVLAASKANGSTRLLATAAQPWVHALGWVDDPYVYWVEGSTPTGFTRVSLNGGTPELVPTQGSVRWLAFDACNVYVAETNPAQVIALPK